MSERTATRGTATLPARVTTPLLTLITQQSLDEDYETVARRRSVVVDPQAGTAPGDYAHVARRAGGVTGRVGRTSLAIALLFGLLIGVAVVQNSRNAPVRNATREELVTRINERHTQLATYQSRIATLRDDNGKLSSSYADLGSQLRATTSSVNALGEVTGFRQVSDAGLRIVVKDADGSSSGEVRDSDLNNLVNALWQSGASAISINGQRVTALSQPRNSGSVVRINDVSLSSPYVIHALGKPSDLQSRVFDTTSGAEFLSVVQQFGMPLSVQNVSDLTAPAAPNALLSLPYATTGDAADSIQEEQP